MPVSVFDLFKVGIGPSSSHTVGPMLAARRFLEELESDRFEAVSRVAVELFGSLALTGKGHGTDRAVLLGLAGEAPDGVDVDAVDSMIARMRERGAVALLGRREIAFDEAKHLVFRFDETFTQHSNAIRFTASGAGGEEIARRLFFSVGGGFVLAEEEMGQPLAAWAPLPFDFHSADELLRMGRERGMPIAEIMLANERAVRPEKDVLAGLDRIWAAMRACVERGLTRDGILPGGLNVRRRAKTLHERLLAGQGNRRGPLEEMDWIDVWALAVNEENAAGGRVVTAPTNGAAGIVPAVMMYYHRFCQGADRKGLHAFLLSATAIGSLYKENASISGAEVGCQGEVGVAASMAAAGLTAALGGTNEQIENAAEIAMEHNLGLTCDPVGGLVQIPCIERNAMGAVNAVNAARLALRGDGSHHVSLDKVIETMRQTGADMQVKYKETSQGGLAVNVVAC